ncbi:hypothetical protein JIN85_01285 [Luteolibacter pohnpeiensis]|uniref:Glycoamylase-like domain-containing protein n=1 Tax=Luteolibacter pohnpeiensis TaxID=454153 RepID=A0A934S4F5_9BACT|nr:hypothetical protein [Luteolibacter pohnpeiensis]MBK1881025.1 hypothetical protein [Luteolibacter pohnpeiensis]
MNKMRGFRWWIILVLLQGLALGETVWQPVTNYSISFPGERLDAAPRINPFENFTNFGTDFGWMGPGQKRIDANAGVIRVKAAGEWTGVWHSLAGLATEVNRQLDPTDVLGLGGPEQWRAPIRGVTIDVQGKGTLKIELVNSAGEVRWTRSLELTPGERTRNRFDVEPSGLGELKFFNWVVEPGCSANVSSIGFEVERPKMEPEEWMFRVSLGKLRRCHDPISGLTRDRAHVPPGVFDSVASTGMFAMASAVAAAEGILDRPEVEKEVRHTAQVVLDLPRAAGFLPHFVQRSEDGRLVIHPGTEFSTVDTAIALHGLRLAADVLNLEDVSAEVGKAIEGLDFDALTDENGWIGHGFREDRETALTAQWRDWGGETAMVLALEGMVPDREPRGRMEGGGQVFRGVGFIVELQSLFYPDFDRPEPDLITGTVWPEARRNLLLRQMSYVQEQWPDSPAARAGIFGLSAGEIGLPGDGYAANGVDVVGLRWLYPHEMVMSLALSGGKEFGEGIRRLSQAGLLYPVGLPENVEVGLVLNNPMQGSLNAAFEALASYHGWRRGKGAPDVLDDASYADPMLRRGAARFYR